MYIGFMKTFGFIAASAQQTKLCINCKHFIKPNFFMNDKFGRCLKYPKSNDSMIDYLVTGKRSFIIDEYPYCSTTRKYEHTCGIEGKSFEQKPDWFQNKS